MALRKKIEMKAITFYRFFKIQSITHVFHKQTHKYVKKGAIKHKVVYNANGYKEEVKFYENDI